MVKQLQDQLNENKDNKVSGSNGINDNYESIVGVESGDMMTNNNEEISNEVSESYKNELTINSGKIVENEVFKGDTVKINSGDENIETVVGSKRVMGVGDG